MSRIRIYCCLLLMSSAVCSTVRAACGDYGCDEVTEAPVRTSRKAVVTANQEIRELIADDCGQSIDSKNYTFEVGKHYIWKVSASKPSQRVVLALEYYGDTWIYRSMMVDDAGTLSKPINRASPNKPTGSALPAPSESRSLLVFNCTKQVFAVFSGGDMNTDYMSKEKLLVQACDRQRIMPGFLVMSASTDTSIIVDFALLTAASSPDDIPRFIITSWPVDLPPGATIPTTTQSTTTTTTQSTTTTTTKPSTTTTKSTTTTTTTKPSTTTTKPLTTTTRTTTTTTTPRQQQQAACGRAPASIVRVLGGQAAPISQYPWLVQLRYKSGRASNAPFEYSCIGTLIHPSWVATALHCFFPDKSALAKWIVIAGAANSTTPPTASGVRQERIASLKWRDDLLGDEQDLNNYNPITDAYDIVLLKLAKPITNFTPMCLPGSDWRLNPSVDYDCKLPGWGATTATSSSISVGLNVADIDLISSRTCNQREWYNGRVKMDFICAGKDGVDSCKGDGGTSVNCMNPATQRYELIGIASWGRSPCGTATKPGVYVQVPYHSDWINGVINPQAATTARSQDYGTL